FLRRVAAHPAYAAGALDTGFIPRYAGELLPPAGPAPREALVAAALRVLSDQHRDSERAAVPGDPWSPWNAPHSWRMNSVGYQDLVFLDGNARITIRVHPQLGGDFQALFSGALLRIRGNEDCIWIDGFKTPATVLRQGDRFTVILDGINHDIHWIDP